MNHNDEYFLAIENIRLETMLTEALSEAEQLRAVCRYLRLENQMLMAALMGIKWQLDAIDNAIGGAETRLEWD